MHGNYHLGAGPGLAAPEAARQHPAGLSPHQVDETPGLAGTEGFREQASTDSSDCAHDTDPAQSKRLSTLRAELALAGWTLTDSPENQHGQFIASRWGLARDLRDLDAAEAFCRQVGATK